MKFHLLTRFEPTSVVHRQDKLKNQIQYACSNEISCDLRQRISHKNVIYIKTTPLHHQCRYCKDILCKKGIRTAIVHNEGMLYDQWKHS